MKEKRCIKGNNTGETDSRDKSKRHGSAFIIPLLSSTALSPAETLDGVRLASASHQAPIQNRAGWGLDPKLCVLQIAKGFNWRNPVESRAQRNEGRIRYGCAPYQAQIRNRTVWVSHRKLNVSQTTTYLQMLTKALANNVLLKGPGCNINNTNLSHELF